MTSIIGIFILSLSLSLFITPQVIKIAYKFNILDMPSERKIHTHPVPRIGGLAIFIAFFISLLISRIHPTLLLEQINNPQIEMLVAGAFLSFGLGFWDDITRLGPKIKFIIQIIAAYMAYVGGIAIPSIGLFDIVIDLEFLSLPFTIFWFLLVINSVNLIDGLDGLAAGISLFISLILLIICMINQNYLIALIFAALSGSILGFLKYNFNPASIFMGDSGSYFLGYMLAGLSIIGSLKGSTTVAILIPVIALGIPLIDVIFSPLRRFILGQKLFSPDKKHLHHQLIKLGFSQTNAVLILYGFCIIMGICAIITVHAKSEAIAVILIILGAIAILGIRKLGYMNYFGISKVFNWFQDVSDEIGITHDRRNFLNLQVDISESKNVDSLWINICNALDRLGFDMAEMYIQDNASNQICQSCSLSDNSFTQPPLNKKIIVDYAKHMTWTRDGFTDQDICEECIMKMELPLIDINNYNFGYIWLIKDLKRAGISHYTLRRVEHLRRTVMGSLRILMQN